MAPVKTLWSTPDSILERLDFKGRDQEWDDFLLCGFYCSVAVIFLLIFGIAAVFRDEIAYAIVILGFAAATCIIYGAIWLTGQFHLARHFVVTLMASLCLFLFYSGGTQNTGPLYLFVFPVVAVFLQGVRLGVIFVIALPLFTIFMQQSGFLGFDTQRYDYFFISRIYAIYFIISLLTSLFAWFREKAELELLLSHEDLENVTHGDLLTGLANKAFMERLIELEFSRFRRYGNSFSLLAIQVDDMPRIRRKHGSQYSNAIYTQLATLLLQKLRTIDIPSRWHDDYFLIMLPEASLENAWGTAIRIRGHVAKQEFMGDRITVSIGISVIADDLDDAINQAEENMLQAGQGNGDSIVTGKQLEANKAEQGLSSVYKDA